MSARRRASLKNSAPLVNRPPAGCVLGSPSFERFPLNKLVSALILSAFAAVSFNAAAASHAAAAPAKASAPAAKASAPAAKATMSNCKNR